jgi:hypothetical protein
MRLKELLLMSSAVLFLSAVSPAADINAASCSQSDVQSAINSAADGDTIHVPAQSCTWSSAVNIQNKGITLQGAGIGQSTINDPITGGPALAITVSSGHSLTRVTGFTFSSSATKSVETGFVQVDAANDALDSFRIDNFRIANMFSRGVMIYMHGYDLSGVIDSCEIDGPNNVTAQGIAMEGTSPQDGTPFTRPMTLGSNHAIYIEDCTFNYTYNNDGAYDAYTGARYVFRHNTVKGTIIGHHGADSGSGRGIASFEIYDNTFDANGHNVSRIMFFRSGTGVVFGNTATSGSGSYSQGIIINNYRSCQSYTYWGQCNGSSAWDNNQNGEQGYACLDQVGHYFTPSQGGSNTLVPLYGWNNVLDGAALSISKDSPANTCSTFQNVHMIEGREFYNGTTAPGYTPYTYPHPLRSGGGNPPPAAPSNVTATVK